MVCARERCDLTLLTFERLVQGVLRFDDPLRLVLAM